MSDRQRYRHYKGEVYILLIDNAKLECDGTIVCVYESETTGTIYVRPREEFFSLVTNPNSNKELTPRFAPVVA